MFGHAFMQEFSQSLINSLIPFFLSFSRMRTPMCADTLHTYSKARATLHRLGELVDVAAEAPVGQLLRRDQAPRSLEDVLRGVSSLRSDLHTYVRSIHHTQVFRGDDSLSAIQRPYIHTYICTFSGKLLTTGTCTKCRMCTHTHIHKNSHSIHPPNQPSINPPTTHYLHAHLRACGHMPATAL
jgi:hypothetical protein